MRNQSTGRGQERGQERGRKGGRALKPGGECFCPKCGYTVQHQRGVPCYEIKCPECGTTLARR